MEGIKKKVATLKEEKEAALEEVEDLKQKCKGFTGEIEEVQPSSHL